MDILVYAIKMELDGERFYRENAVKNKGNSLERIFNMLADDEADHARVLEDKSKGLSYQLNVRVPAALKNVFHHGTEDFKNAPEQLDVYKMALEKEKQSIDLYKKLLAETADCADLYQFLIEEEEDHAKILEEIIEHVSRPKVWVESAEFGNRKEY